jgi:trans-aconitate 2-methyltransferase
MSTYSYSFGDTPTAADRLTVMAQVFGPEMRSFLSQWTHLHPELAVDLGCGPGHTTRLLSEILHARLTVGRDTSEAFLSVAQQLASPNIGFIKHDVTVAPFPAGPADIMFAHLLLYHLPDSAAALETWASQLQFGGLILVDDVESMETDHPILHRYLEIVGDLVQNAGGNPTVGAALAHLAPIPSLRLVANEVIDFEVATADAATIFRMNLHTWRTNPYIVGRYAASAIGDLAANLDLLRESGERNEILWKFRQMAFIRV